ncbi:hypothetical protein CY35_13G081000 [Sphagnum magellanicum]|nr:hypothetical protein CY35_13G081000 [Sphagnum magellanicum]KAH9543751.1 hypothetical protein CY35_13G081000 [Sphagnum magellanicum]
MRRRLAMWTASHLMRPLPGPGEVHVWCLFPEDITGEDTALWKTYKELLSAREKTDIAQCSSNPKLQTEKLLARTLVRTTLARYASGIVAPSSLRFTKNEFGKPNVIWPVKRLDEWRPPSLCFNLTHTQSLLMCAVTQKAEVGIDVEERERKFTRDLMALARRQLSPEEADWLSQFTDPYEQRCQFMQLWTLKEAYVKALGKGISKAPLKEFTFTFDASSPTVLRNLKQAVTIPICAQARTISLKVSALSRAVNNSDDAWQFLLLQPSASHYASICTQILPSSTFEQGSLQLEGWSDHNNLRVQIWRTVPLVRDEALEGAVALALSDPLSS